MRNDVLIAGAGPTGLVLALWLTKQGVPVRIIDKCAEAATTSRALAVQARTLELYRLLDMADEIVARGYKVPAINLWVKGARKAHIPFDQAGAGLTPYPFLLIFPQDEHERLLKDRLTALGVTVQRQTELLGFTEQGGGITARLRLPDGTEETCHAAYIAGCDGARSIVRETIKAGFPGGTYQHVFYVADVDAAGPAVKGEVNIDVDSADFLAVFPLAGEGRVRFVGTVREQPGSDDIALKFDDVSGRAIADLKLQVHHVNWFSTYRVHHRVADHFRHGRAFLLGDAAHIHSPAGGQGMNTGIGDAINLAWKLAAVLDGQAPDTLLDSYETERIGFARQLVATTDRVFTLASSEGRAAAFMRTRVMPLVMPALARLAAVREFSFRTVSQIGLNYRHGPLSQGIAGTVHGGNRLPWVAAPQGGNYRPLSAIAWQAHVYGNAHPMLQAWCEINDLPLHVFGWTPAHQSAGLSRDALYLLRPDTYVALADPQASPIVLAKYFADHAISLPTRQPILA